MEVLDILERLYFCSSTFLLVFSFISIALNNVSSALYLSCIYDKNKFRLETFSSSFLFSLLILVNDTDLFSVDISTSNMQKLSFVSLNNRFFQTIVYETTKKFIFIPFFLILLILFWPIFFINFKMISFWNTKNCT